MDAYIAPSLKRALRSPKYFQTVPLLVRATPSVPLQQVGQQIFQKWNIEMGSIVPSMGMFGIVVPTNLVEELIVRDDVAEVHLDTPQFAFNEQVAPLPGLPPLPALPGMSEDGGLAAFSQIASTFQNPLPLATDEGWIPTAEALKAIHVPELWKAGLEGNNVNLAVLDTGVDNNQAQLQQTVKQRSTMKAFPTGHDENGHGTWCVTCIKGRPMRDPMYGLPVSGIAPKCDISSWKVLGYGIGTGSTSDIMAAIDKAVADGNTIISMSLGSEGREDEDQDPMVRQINQYVEQRPEILFVVAAGNSGPDLTTVGVPGVAEGAITVGSWGLIDQAPAYFSSRGPTLQSGRIKPDIMAPGGGRQESTARPKETIFSGTAFASLLDSASDKLPNSWTSIAGTSMATPAVAAILAQWKQMYPELTVHNVKDIFKLNGVEKNPLTGWGLIDARWILEYA